MGIVAWIVFGLIVGIVAKLAMPGPDPGGFAVTILLGIAGAFVGGFVGRALGFYGPNNQGVGWMMAIAGSVVLLLIYRVLAPKRTI